jgi:outer membrane protein
MALRNSNRLGLLAVGLLAAAPLAGQAPAPLRLSFGDAVRRVAGEAPPPPVLIAGLRTDAATARVRQARAALLPSLTVAGSWANRDFNSKAQGISFPGVPTIIGPFNSYDGRVRATQTLFDPAAFARVGAARGQVTSASADRRAVIEAAAQVAGLAYLRAARAEATVAARRADSTLAAELVGLARAQRDAGVSAAIDVTRARTQLAEASGALIVATNQRDRTKIDLARALGVDPATPIALADTLSANLAAVDVPPGRDSAVALALGARPDLVAEQARGAAARRAASAIAAERLPKLEVEADYGLSGVRMPDAVSTRQLALQVTVPILDGFRREGRLAEQHAAVRESDVRARDLGQQVAADVESALLDMRSAAAQLTIAADRLGLANEEVTQARERFKAGVAGNIEVINAQASLLKARDADIDARFAAAAARVALARAVGSARQMH